MLQRAIFLENEISCKYTCVKINYNKYVQYIFMGQMEKFCVFYLHKV